MNDPRPYELFAVRYATKMRTDRDVFIGGDLHGSPVPMDYFVWAARNDTHTVVIDTGFDAGNLQKFPNARFHLQEREMAFATGRYMSHPFFAHAYDIDAVVSMVRLVYAAQVQFHDGDAEVVPGITVHHVGGHTHGLQVVRVWTRLGWIVLASDAAHYLANLSTGRPFPIVANVMEMTRGWERLTQLASRPHYIVPGHDPIVMERYREPEPSLKGVAVRLDAEPGQPLDASTQGGTHGNH